MGTRRDCTMRLMSEAFRIRVAVEDDVPLILRFIRELAEYEKLPHECVATEDSVRSTLFGSPRFAEVLIVEQTFPSAPDADASHVIPSEVEGPGRTGGAPPTSPGPSQPALSAVEGLGMTTATPAGFALFFHNYS